MKLLKLSLLILLSVLTDAKAQAVSKVIVYRGFSKGGSTIGLLHTFHHPRDCGAQVDTSNINVRNLLTPADFMQLLKTAKKKRHFQQKIAGVVFAGEMMIEGQKHFYLYFGPDLLIDLTARINYWLDSTCSSSFDKKSKELPIAK